MQNIRHTDNRFIMEWEQDYVIAFIEACQQIYGIIKQKTVGTNTWDTMLVWNCWRI